MIKTGFVNVHWSTIRIDLCVMENLRATDVNFPVELATKAQSGVEV